MKTIRKWTTKEDNILRENVAKFSYSEGCRRTAEATGRSSKACGQHYYKIMAVTSGRASSSRKKEAVSMMSYSMRPRKNTLWHRLKKFFGFKGI